MGLAEVPSGLCWQNWSLKLNMSSRWKTKKKQKYFLLSPSQDLRNSSECRWDGSLATRLQQNFLLVVTLNLWKRIEAAVGSCLLDLVKMCRSSSVLRNELRSRNVSVYLNAFIYIFIYFSAFVVVFWAMLSNGSTWILTSQLPFISFQACHSALPVELQVSFRHSPSFQAPLLTSLLFIPLSLFQQPINSQSKTISTPTDITLGMNEAVEWSGECQSWAPKT